jgi:hypothetical protein
MRPLAPLSLFVLASLSSGPASAKCMMPSPTLVPPSGKVPVAATLRLLVPELGAAKPPSLTARAGTKAMPLVVTRLDTGASDLAAYAVHLAATPGGPVVVELAGKYSSTTWTLDVDGAWKPPTVAKETPKIGRVATSWTCSHELSRALTFTGGVAGYRVITAAKQGDLADPKKTKSVYLPSTPHAFFGGPLTSAPTVDLRLGYLNCFGDTYRFESAAVWAEIRALLPDGTEPLVTTAPFVLGAP